MPSLFPGYVGSVDVQHQRKKTWLRAAVGRAVVTSHSDPGVEATEISVAVICQSSDSTVGSWQEYPGLQVEPWESENHRHSSRCLLTATKDADATFFTTVHRFCTENHSMKRQCAFHTEESLFK